MGSPQLREVVKAVVSGRERHQVCLVRHRGQHLAPGPDHQDANGLVHRHVKAVGRLKAYREHEDHHRGGVEDDAQHHRDEEDTNQQSRRPERPHRVRDVAREQVRHLGVADGVAEPKRAHDREHCPDLDRVERL
eukprot:CAMPEP_0179000870 /NCGR_PEP_ID=MMETSP0795-20121207/10964_1 /TAXON_ID=88552 /ORGANISM="Amoebophrya sp., Strain Ameob2" /LENGTH=133 /DNA_ID=CAMNT_0020694019 /DNA_START=465 /DNA_END=862 /DNA_ORIENTATION=-